MKTLCLKVWGDYACFTRPEMNVERRERMYPTRQLNKRSMSINSRES